MRSSCDGASVSPRYGLAIGVVGTVWLTRYLSAMLFGLTPLDGMTYVAVVALFATASLMACYLPARRAMLVDPAVALRHE